MASRGGEPIVWSVASGRSRSAGERTDGRRRRWWVAPAAAWCVIAAVLFVVQRVSLWVLEGGELLGPPVLLVDGWRQFDSHQYIAIATHGYWYDPSAPSNVVWFPLYPIAARVTAPVVGSVGVAAFLVAVASGAAAAVAYWRWIVLKVPEPSRLIAWAALLLSPYAFFLYGAMYADGLFLALAVGSFLCVEDRRPVLAGLVGAAATAARPTGVCLMPALLLLELQRSGVLAGSLGGSGWRSFLPGRLDRARLRLRSFGVLLALLGVGSYSLCLWVRFGAPFAWYTNEQQFHPAVHDWQHAAVVDVISSWVDRGLSAPRYPLSVIVQASMVVATLVASPFVGRRYGWGYGLYTALVAAVPLWGVDDFFGSGRYVLAAFPAFALLGEGLSRRPVRAQVLLVISAAVMVGLTAGFGHRWYLS